MNQSGEIDYLKLVELIEQFQLDVTACELHGLVTGGACTVSLDLPETNWLSLIAPHNPLEQDQLEQFSTQIQQVLDATLEQLNSQLFEFTPVLPDEDSSSIFRTEELAAWCRGFLTVCAQHPSLNESLSEQASEAIEDLSQITLAIVGEGEEEQYQQALAELEEYLRVSVQLIFEDLNPVQTIH